MVKTLNELVQLKNSDFNQPHPRHGLNLLHWFAHTYVIEQAYNNEHDPTTGVYGFHRFYNRIEVDDDKLLPNQNLPYYEVGNLNAPGADKLPSYVRPTNMQYYNESNKDRIIVRLNHGRIDRVYVTQHVDQKNFDNSHTYRVSQGLLNQISGMKRQTFLKDMQQQPNYSFTNQSKATNDNYTNQQSDNSWCTIL